MANIATVHYTGGINAAAHGGARAALSGRGVPRRASTTGCGFSDNAGERCRVAGLARGQVRRTGRGARSVVITAVLEVRKQTSTPSTGVGKNGFNGASGVSMVPLNEVGLTWDEEEMDKDVQNLPSKLQEWGTNSMVWGAPLEEEMCASEGDVLGSIAPNPMRDDLAIAIEAAEKEAAAKEEKNAVQELVDEVVEAEQSLENYLRNAANTTVGRWVVRFLIIPSIISRVASVTVIHPVLQYQFSQIPNEQLLTEEDQAELMEETENFEKMLQYNEVMGRAPKLDIEKREEVVKSFATGKEEEAAEHTLQVDTNRFQDLVFFAVLAYMVTKNNEDMKIGLRAIKKNFFDMQPAQQAFFLLLSSDVLVGYHSADGWQTALKVLGGHYGVRDQEEAIAIFVALVPVSIDVLFKFWVFKYLRMLAPSTQVILDDLD